MLADRHGGGVPSPAGHRRRTVVLASPLHPLRLLWLVTWAELGQHWLESSADAHAEPWTPPGGLSAELTPLGFPFVVPLRGGRLTIAAADLTPYWGACLPTDTPDPQGLLASLARALRLPERSAAVTWSRHGCSRTGSSVTCASTRTCPRSSSARSTPVAREQLADMLVELAAPEAPQARQLRHPDLRPRRSTERGSGRGAGRPAARRVDHGG